MATLTPSRVYLTVSDPVKLVDFINQWREQGYTITDLRTKVQRGIWWARYYFVTMEPVSQAPEIMLEFRIGPVTEQKL